MTTIKELNLKFKYKQDKNLDSWRILGSGKWEGDCDDYAITAAYILSNNSLFRLYKNILFGRMKLWFCRLPSGENHICLEYEDSFRCNVFPKPSPGPRSKLLFKVLLPLVLLKLAVGKING